MKMTSRVLLVLFVCSLSGAAERKLPTEKLVDLTVSIPRIIGGNEAIPHEYPFQAGLLINGNQFCGGSLISPNFVLTAAHCAVAITESVYVILGAHNITAAEDTQRWIWGSEITIHEFYNTVSYQYDIAVIRLADPVELDEYVQTIPLASRSSINTTYDYDTVTSIGWGMTQDVDHNPSLNDISQILKYVEVEVQPLQDCGNYYNDNIYNITFVTELNICTSGYKNRGTCRGDSGGPLIHDGVQIGLVSIGTTLCELCSPSIFTKIASHLDWIEEHTDAIIT